MKKSIIALVLIVGMALAFGAGVAANENGILGNVFGRMAGDVRGNTDSLINSMNGDIVEQIEGALEDVINAQSNRANTQIEAYFNQKVEELSTHPDVINMGNDIMHMTTGLINEEKARIDDAVDSVLNGQ